MSIYIMTSIAVEDVRIPEYRAIARHHRRASRASVVVVEGLDAAR